MRSRLPEFDVNDREMYPLELDEVPESEFHDLQTDYLCDALRAYLPHWRVFRNLSIFWQPRVVNVYWTPALFAVAGAIAGPLLWVYQTWQDPPVKFAADVGSRSAFVGDREPKPEVYSRDIQAAEYLYTNPPEGDLRLWRMGPGGAYREVAQEENGRLRSEELGLEFGLEEGFLWAYTRAGERLRSHRESERDREVAETRAQAEAQEREAAEARAQAEERRREAAEARVAEERALREQMERRILELQAKLAHRGDAGEGPNG